MPRFTVICNWCGSNDVDVYAESGYEGACSTKWECNNCGAESEGLAGDYKEGKPELKKRYENAPIL